MVSALDADTLVKTAVTQSAAWTTSETSRTRSRWRFWSNP